MGGNIYTKAVIYPILLVFVAACGNPKQLEADKKSLQTENEALKTRVQQLTDEKSKFKSELDGLKAELDDLKQTDQYLYSRAKEQLDSSNNIEAKELFEKLLTRFPNSIYKAQATGLLKDLNSKIAIAAAIENGESEINSAVSSQEFSKAWVSLRSIKKYISEDKYNDLAKKIDNEQNKPISVYLIDLLADKDKYNARRVRIGYSKAMLINVSTKSFNVQVGDEWMLIDYSNMPDQERLRRIERGQSINYVVGIFKNGYMWGGTYIESRIEAEEISY